jgi:hypothetical protein
LFRYLTFLLLFPLLLKLSENKLQSELDQARIIDLTAHDPEVRFVRDIRDRRTELYAIEDVEEFSPELNSKPIVGTEIRRLEEGEVEVLDPVLAQLRIHARLVSESEIGRVHKTGGIEPLIEARLRAAGAIRFATGDAVGPRAGAELRRQVCVAELQRKAALKRGNALNTPTRYQLLRTTVNPGEEFPAAPERKIQHITDNQSLWNVLR